MDGIYLNFHFKSTWINAVSEAGSCGSIDDWFYALFGMNFGG